MLSWSKISSLYIIFFLILLRANDLTYQFDKIDRDEDYIVNLLVAENQRLAIKKEKERLKKLEIERRKRDRQIKIKIKLSNQVMRVFKGNKSLYKWRVSTARRGYKTPTGRYKPIYLEKLHLSKEYKNAEMPYSIFFKKGGYAIHGTNAINRLGRRASHGCVRLNPKNAKRLYLLVLKYGKINTSIEIEH